MPDARFPVEMARGVPVVSAPEEIDINNADGLRTALLESAAQGPGTVVVNLAGTKFCDTAGLHALVSARKRALAGGGEVMLVMAGAAVQRILAITGLDQVFPTFTSLEDALAQVSGAESGLDRGPSSAGPSADADRH